MRDGAGIDLIMDELRDISARSWSRSAPVNGPAASAHLIKLGETAGCEGTSTGEMAAK